MLCCSRCVLDRGRMESAEGGRPRPRVARQKDISDLDQVTQDTASATSSPEGVRARIGLYENLSKGVAYQVGYHSDVTWWRHEMTTFSALLALC